MIVKQMKVVAATLSCVGILLMPANVMAASTVGVVSQTGSAPRDISLQKGGVLVGQVLNAQGIGIADVSVLVSTGGKEIARVTTDRAGKFAASGIKGGVHQVTAVGQQNVYRLWAPGTAPPSSQRGLMLVPSTEVVRGQCDCGTPVCGSACGNGGGGYGGGVFGGGGGVRNWLANHPLIAAGGIAAAIAVPLALDDDESPATP